MKILRTPDERFDDLVDYPFLPNYTVIQTADGSDLRIHHLDEGPKDGPLVLCMHCLLYTSPSPRDRTRSRMPSSA